MKLLLRVIILCLITEIAFMMCDMNFNPKSLYFFGIVVGVMVYHCIAQTFVEYIIDNQEDKEEK